MRVARTYDPRMDDESSRRGGRGRGRDLVREWWWAALPVMVVLSVAVSGITGRPGPGEARPTAPTPRASDDAGVSAPIVVSVAHRLPVGHLRPIPFDVDACVAARTGPSTKREAQRYCLALAHLSTPFG
jgi:hypothetical protein